MEINKNEKREVPILIEAVEDLNTVLYYRRAAARHLDLNRLMKEAFATPLSQPEVILIDEQCTNEHASQNTQTTL